MPWGVACLPALMAAARVAAEAAAQRKPDGGLTIDGECEEVAARKVLPSPDPQQEEYVSRPGQ